MVRLVITDFSSVQENERFHSTEEYEKLVKVFTYEKFKKYEILLSKYEINDKIYSLNLLSKKHLPKNRFLIHIADEEFYILFNHKTIYYAKINKNFITDDMIKSILITRHMTMLSSGGEIDTVYYVINSKYKNAIENVLRQNTKNEKNEVIAKPLGNVESLVSNLNELDTTKSYITKTGTILVLSLGLIWFIFSGMNTITKKIFNKESLTALKKEMLVERRLAKRQKILLRSKNKKYNKLIKCISKKEVQK